jgi:hypothetical protein
MLTLPQLGLRGDLYLGCSTLSTIRLEAVRRRI